MSIALLACVCRLTRVLSLRVIKRLLLSVSRSASSGAVVSVEARLASLLP